MGRTTAIRSQISPGKFLTQLCSEEEHCSEKHINDAPGVSRLRKDPLKKLFHKLTTFSQFFFRKCGQLLCNNLIE